ncbi:MAG: hypothetical protein KDB63_03585 [Nocardioidaceae bacterium]|nr:hypothetical protein [Nocardioidaceae bacterium]
MQRRDASWVLLGFRNLDDDVEGRSLAIGDPIPVVLQEGCLVAAAPTGFVGA